MLARLPPQERLRSVASVDGLSIGEVAQTIGRSVEATSIAARRGHAVGCGL